MKNKTKDLTLNYVSIGIIGFLLGIISSYIYFQTPITENGIDYDGDGMPDEWWISKGNFMSETRIDRNLDKKIDAYFYYNNRGTLESSKSDNDFDGVFESITKYKKGNPIITKIDTNGDDFKNYRFHFENGVLKTSYFINPQTKQKIRINYFTNEVMTKSKTDTTGDGVLDTEVQYDQYENPLISE